MISVGRRLARFLRAMLQARVSDGGSCCGVVPLCIWECRGVPSLVALGLADRNNTSSRTEGLQLKYSKSR